MQHYKRTIKSLGAGILLSLAYLLWIHPWSLDPDHQFAKDGTIITSYDWFMHSMGAWISQNTTGDKHLIPSFIIILSIFVGLILDYIKPNIKNNN
jgi:hypothetical protein